MKKLITVVLLFCVVHANSQTADYFAGNPQWRLNQTLGGFLPCLYIYNYVYYMNGNQVIDGKKYQKMFRKGTLEEYWMGGPPPECSGTSNYDYLNGLFRQEDQKIFMRDGNADVMLYDFDLEVGDTLPNSPLLYEENIYVTQIDSILVGSYYRKVFSLSVDVFGNNQMIEGIGFVEGFLTGFPDYFYPESLACFALNEIVYYVNPNPSAPCNMFVGTAEPSTESTCLEILPNPSTGLFTLSLSGAESHFLQIYIHDISGRLIYQESWQTENATSVKCFNLSELKKGLYFLSLSDEAGHYFINEKIVLY
ncbi:MAG: T9SS type A sorting domain-containing protein [Clostridia bacterium]|nr:T9SS type A sorting domain-containing protein [Clostridia bacterium]